ncbi:MAG: HAD family hydrolase [Thermodesulfobacteriota bacterium]|nr:HAD family hydrolase [Thermodesulfobacteriota bacterium]
MDNGETFMTYKAVLFDLDGTLINTLEDIGDAVNRVLINRGFPIHTTDAYRYFVGDGAAKLIKRALPVEEQGDETFEACLQAFKEDYAQNWNVKTRLYEGISEMLDTLSSHNIKIAILSNKPHEFTEQCVSEFLPHWNFQVVMGQQDPFPLKPDPRGALEIARLLEVLPEETLYLGDTSIDMNTAKAAGMFPVGVLWGFRHAEELKQSGARVLITEPIQIINMLS